MIVTLMFSQAAFLTVLYFGELYPRRRRHRHCRHDPQDSLFGLPLDLTSITVRYNIALTLLALTVAGLFVLVRSSFGRVLVAIRENEKPHRHAGYDVARHKLAAFAGVGLPVGPGRSRLCAALCLCRFDARLDPVFHPSAALDASRRGIDPARPRFSAPA